MWQFKCSLLLFCCFNRPHAPSHNQVTTETAENRAPASDHDSVSTASSGGETGRSLTKSTSDSASECQETAGGDPENASFVPGHSRSFSEPFYSNSNHNRSISQLSRISGYSTGHSISSSLERRLSRRYCWWRCCILFNFAPLFLSCHVLLLLAIYGIFFSWWKIFCLKSLSCFVALNIP